MTVWCRLVGLFALLLPCAVLVGCSVDTADGDYPEGEEAISFSRAILGAETSVLVYRSRSESKPCSLESGEFGYWIDCARFRDLAARLTLVECLPRTACRDVSFDGAKGSFVPLVSVFEVHVVADIEGERLEVTRAVNAKRPEREVEIHPAQTYGHDDALLEGRVAVACAHAGNDASGLDGLAWSATLDGEPLEPVVPEKEGSTDLSCFSVRPDRAGTIRFSVALTSPALELGSASARVRGVDEIESLVVNDTFCLSAARRPEAASVVGAYEYDKGAWYIHFMARAALSGGGGAYLPAKVARFVDGADAEPLKESDAGLALQRTVEPSAEARIEIVLGDRTVTLPVIVDTCR